MASKKKITTAAVAIATAAAITLGGTFAWQSINQTALNEASDVINPGGRLHDDFDGTNKDVYVENFTDTETGEDIFARVRLDEYFEIVMNKGTGAEKIEVFTQYTDDNGDLQDSIKEDTSTYETHIFGSENATDEYWEWLTGGETTYMPTFNKDKDSLKADINGTYDGRNPDDDIHYDDYEEVPSEKTADAEYDADTDNLDNGGTIPVNETHYASGTLDAELISMQEWINRGSQPGEYWVYDTDGWVYWAQAIKPQTATGLLLDEIKLTQVMDDSWYYAINVVAQFVTADDLGRGSGTGFYDLANGSAPTTDALALLEAIGVDTTSVISDEAALREALVAGGNIEIDGEITSTSTENGGLNVEYDFLWDKGGTMSGGTLTSTSNAYTTLFINNELGWPDGDEIANAATLEDTTITTSATFGIYNQAIDAPVNIKDVTVNGENGGIYAEYGDEIVTLDNVTVVAKGTNSSQPWFNSAVAAGMGANVVVNSGSYTGEYAAYVYSSGATLTINGGYFDGKLKEDNAALIITGGTFTVDPTEFVADGYEATYDDEAETWTVDVKEAGRTSFENTDDLEAPPYVVFTADESGESAMMFFTRTYDDITSDPGSHTVDGRPLTEVYSGTESWYVDTEIWPELWDTYYIEKVISAEFINNMQPISTRYWFYNMTNLQTITGLEKLDTSRCTNMRGMFQVASSLSSLDVSHFDTDLVTDMGDMFSCVPCAIIGLEKLDTSNVTDMSWMFNACNGLTELDLSDWNVQKVESFAGMFFNCTNLTKIEAENWNTSSATSSYSMFEGCSNLVLDCSGWNVGNATDSYWNSDFNTNAPNVIAPNFSFLSVAE